MRAGESAFNKQMNAQTGLLVLHAMAVFLARDCEGGKKTGQTEKEVGRHHQGMDGLGVRQVSEGSGKQRKMEETGCEVICGAPTAPR